MFGLLTSFLVFGPDGCFFEETVFAAVLGRPAGDPLVTRPPGDALATRPDVDTPPR